MCTLHLVRSAMMEKMETLDMSRSLLSRRDFVCLVSTPSFISCLTLMDFLLPAQATHEGEKT